MPHCYLRFYDQCAGLRYEYQCDLKRVWKFDCGVCVVAPACTGKVVCHHNCNPVGMVALPFCHISLKVERSDGYKKFADCKTLGDHIRRRRCMLGLWQKELAQMFGVCTWTVLNWEKNVSSPVVRAYPAIMKFLGYCPIQNPQTLGDRIRLHRVHLGYSQSKFSKILGVDECTLSSWECGVKSPFRHARSRAIIRKILLSED